jgi:hypothetical protein
MSEEKISQALIKMWGFREYHNSRQDNLDFDKYSCVIRIHEIHYLFWSDQMKHFTLRVKHENPKGLPSGGIQFHTDVMIPKVIYTVEQAFELVNAMVDTDKLHLYNC